MGFNRRKMEAERKAKAGAEAAARRAIFRCLRIRAPDRRLERASARRMALLFSPMIGAANHRKL